MGLGYRGLGCSSFAHHLLVEAFQGKVLVLGFLVNDLEFLQGCGLRI